MIDAIAACACFCLGTFLCIQMLAAWYGILDHGQAIRAHRRRIAGDIAFWTLLFAGLTFGLPDDPAAWFRRGAALVVLVHLLLMALGPLAVYATMRLDRRALEAVRKGVAAAQED